MNARDEREITIEKEYVSWNDVEAFISRLDVALELSKGKFNGVFGPPRGGVTFAAIISNRFDIPYLGAPQPGCLIVDDIIDSGKTAEAWVDKGYTIATMYYKQGATVKPDYYFKEKGDKWIVFSWEGREPKC